MSDLETILSKLPPIGSFRVDIVEIIVAIEPPNIVNLQSIVVSPVTDIEVNIKIIPLYTVEPLIIDMEPREYGGSVDIYYHGIPLPEDLVIQIPSLDDISLLEYDSKDLAVLDDRWRKIFSPLKEIPIEEAPEIAAPGTKSFDKFTSTFSIRIRLTNLPPEEAEEIIHGDFLKEYRITRIVKRMDIVADVRPFIEIYKVLRKFEREKKLYKVLGGKKRRR